MTLSLDEKKTRARAIQKRLDRLFPEPAIPLDDSDPFRLLVSVVLSAQSTDACVNSVTTALFARADTPAAMAALDPATIETIIKPCGLAPSKSKRLVKLSQRLLDAYDGTVPESFSALESLAGVGHKTASVVRCQAFGEPAFAVDTHIHRLAKRWKLSDGSSVRQTEKDLKALFPKADWCRVHLQIIYYGREYCPARSHDVTDCPICSDCEAGTI